MKTRNLVLLAACALGAAALVAWALRPRPILAETAAVSRGVFEQTVSDDGRTRVRERYVVSAPLAGRIERIALTEGDRVRQGDALAVLAPTAPALLDARTERELAARVAASQARFAAAKAQTGRAAVQVDHARADLGRQTKLAAQKFISENVKDEAVLALQTAERGLEAARFAEVAAAHDVEQTRAALARFQSGDAGAKWLVASPVTGAVLKVVQKSEGPVALGAPLLELADPRALEAVVDILSQEAVAVRPGMAARIDLGRGVPPLVARVRLVEPAAFTKISALGVEEQRVNVVLDFAESLERVATLGDGFRVEAHIVIERVDGALKVPVGALWKDGERWALFAVDGGRARKRAVDVLARNPVEARIAGGVAPGDQVVVYPSDAVKDGTRLELRDPKRR